MTFAVVNTIYAIAKRSRDRAIPVRCSNQLSYEATDLGAGTSELWVPVKEMSVNDVYEINHI